jgi:hypothetical protein
MLITGQINTGLTGHGSSGWKYLHYAAYLVKYKYKYLTPWLCVTGSLETCGYRPNRLKITIGGNQEIPNIYGR